MRRQAQHGRTMNSVSTQRFPVPKTKRFVVYDDDHSWYSHGEYASKSYAIKVARLLSVSLNVRVVDIKTNYVVWGK